MRARRSLCALMLGAVAGCGPDNGLTLGRVRGTITRAGEPVRYGFITFQPDASRQTEGQPAMSPISTDGTYALTTLDADDGAVVGTHQVAIIGLDPKPMAGASQPTPEAAPKEFMASKGQQRKPEPKAKKGGATFHSRDGKTYRYVVPEKLGNPTTSGVSAKVERGSNTINFAVKDDGTVAVGP